MYLYADEYQTLTFNNDHSLMQVRWTDATSKLAAKNYSRTVQNVVDYVERRRPENVLADMERFTYTGSLVNQGMEKFQLLKKLMKAGVKKLALIKSQDTITQLIMEQFTVNDRHDSVSTRYFNNEEQARVWLNQVEA
jgi:hypothetical protein